VAFSAAVACEEKGARRPKLKVLAVNSKIRLNRETDYRIFRHIAPEWFQEFTQIDHRHEWREKAFAFYISPKGRWGGLDDRLFDVFYGTRPIKYVTESSSDERNAMPTPKSHFITEHGGQLSYRQNDTGYIICTMVPCYSENFSPLEKVIVLHARINPQRLTSRVLLNKHWRLFSAYAEVSSVDGDPLWRDHLRVWWIRLTRQMVIDGRVQERQVWRLARRICEFSLTVGLSGFLLALIQLGLKKFGR
jgi:hypothetical protein